MDLKKYVPKCPVCGEDMKPMWRDVTKDQKYKCQNCINDGLTIRTYITEEETATEITTSKK